MSRQTTIRKGRKRAHSRLSVTVILSNKTEYNEVTVNLKLWKDMSRGGCGEEEETCSGQVVGAEHVGRTNENNMALCERRRDGLERIDGEGRRLRNVNADRNEDEEESH